MNNSSLPASVLSHPFWDILGLCVCVFSPHVWIRLELVTSWMIHTDTVGMLRRALSLLLLWCQRKQVHIKHFKKQNVTVKTNKWYFNNPIPNLPSKCPFQSRVTVCTVTSRTKYFSLWATTIRATVWGTMVPVSPAGEAVNTVFTQILKAYAGQGRLDSEECYVRLHRISQRDCLLIGRCLRLSWSSASWLMSEIPAVGKQRQDSLISPRPLSQDLDALSTLAKIEKKIVNYQPWI